MERSLVLWIAALLLRGISSTPLDDYVNAPDSHYKYEEVAQPFEGDGYMTYFLNMTSQKWLNESVTSQSIWSHYLVITIPDVIQHPEHAFLYITGGDNGDSVPDVTSSDVDLMLLLAVETGTVTGSLFQVPNQPMYFSEDPLKKRRTEDAVIAFTWWHFMYHPNEPDYLLRLPMTKAGVRGLDTLASFGAKKAPTVSKIDKFVVAGASKRGWTTWTVGAVDKRVVGIVPIVMDLLNINKVRRQH
jgi:PhoPQ-activated pathogenicity-related protein